MEEYFDIVDENNAPTGEKRLRSEAHTQGLWHRTVHIYLFRKKEDGIDFLVHLRSKTKDLHPNKWDTRFGGHVKAGETLEGTVLDELKEEIGLDVKLSDLIVGEVYQRDNFPNREFTAVYYCNFTGDESSLIFSDNEVQRVKWMDSREIPESMSKTPEVWTSKPEEFAEIMNVLVLKLDS